MFAAETGLGATEAVVLTVSSAAFGSFLAVLLESLLAARGSAKHFNALIDGMWAEILQMEQESRIRSERSSAQLSLDLPYSTAAWHALRTSVEVRRLGADYRPIAEFYRTVEIANDRLGHIWRLLQISASAPDDGLRMAYRDLAQGFATAAEDDLRAKLPEVRAVIAGRRLGR